MSYIINSTAPFVSIKLTEKGREKLAQGQLNFSYWGIGDSELNYDREAIVDANQSVAELSGSSRVLRPFDRQPDIKSFITTSTGDNLNVLNVSDINVIKAIVNNAATERGFFTGASLTTYTSITASTFISYSQNLANTNFTGGTVIGGLTTTSAITVGDLILIKLTNNIVTGQTLNSNLLPIPHLWFKVQSKGSTSVSVDRTLPNYLSQTTSSSQIYVYKGGEVYDTIATGNTTAYWDSGTLSFDASSNVTCHDVPVWNMSNVWCENLAGITGLSTTNLYEDFTKFGSYQYLGTKNPFLEYLCQNTATTLTFDCNGPGFSYADDISKSISIIHYTNNSISSLYGEFLYIDTTNSKTVNVLIPDLMYHRRNYSTGTGTTMGMKFISSGDTKFVGTSDIEYVDLIEDVTLIASGATALTIGRVYPQLKIVVIHDDEIVAAISYKSNRNWTLPALAANIIAPSGGTSTGLLAVGETIYLTYSLENNSTTGLTTTLPCQSYVKVSNSTSSAKDISFRIDNVDLLSYMRKIEASDYDGFGFNAYQFKLVYQIVASPNDRPDPGAWKVYDYTSTAITQTVSETINPVLLENQTNSNFVLNTIIDSVATTFDITQSLSMAANTSPETLQFGDERFFYGNLQSYIGATIYKTLFDIRVDSGTFNTTSNPTRSKDLSTNPPNIKISEVGVYDTDKNLVVIGKLSIPVALITGNAIMIELSMDF